MPLITFFISIRTCTLKAWTERKRCVRVLWRCELKKKPTRHKHNLNNIYLGKRLKFGLLDQSEKNKMKYPLLFRKRFRLRLRIIISGTLQWTGVKKAVLVQEETDSQTYYILFSVGERLFDIKACFLGIEEWCCLSHCWIPWTCVLRAGMIKLT